MCPPSSLKSGPRGGSVGRAAAPSPVAGRSPGAQSAAGGCARANVPERTRPLGVGRDGRLAASEAAVSVPVSRTRAMEAEAFHARLPRAVLRLPQSSRLEGEEIRSQTLQNGIFERSILLAVCPGQSPSLSLCPRLAAGREDKGPTLENAKRARETAQLAPHPRGAEDGPPSAAASLSASPLTGPSQSPDFPRAPLAVGCTAWIRPRREPSAAARSNSGRLRGCRSCEWL